MASDIGPPNAVDRRFDDLNAVDRRFDYLK